MSTQGASVTSQHSRGRATARSTKGSKLKPAEVHTFLEAVVGNDIHAKRVLSLADGVVGVKWERLRADPLGSNRERKRMLAYVIEDATLLKVPSEGITKIHIRFRGGCTKTLTTKNPKASWQKVKTSPEVVKLVDRLLDDHIYGEIAEILDDKGLRPGGTAWRGRQGARFTAQRVQYLVHAYHLRSHRSRLLARGLLTKNELARRLGIHEHTVGRWVQYGIIKAHAYNGHAWLYEEPSNPPNKHCSRWDPLVDRAARFRASATGDQEAHVQAKEV